MAAGGRPKLVVASRSVHKVGELRALLDVPEAELLTLDDLGVEGTSTRPARRSRQMLG